MFSVTALLNFARTLGSLVMLGVMLFFYTIYAQAGQATLAWNPNTESTLGGYQLYYGQASGNYTASIDVGKQTNYTLTGLTDGKTYYFAAKAYNIGKTVWSGFSNQVSKTIATTAPAANFSASPTSGPASLMVKFTDTSTGNITTWLWNFGDGSTSPAQNPVKIYAKSGTYTVSLTVNGPGGENTATKINYISVTSSDLAPVANFSASPTSGPAPLAVTFTNSSTNATSYSWDFNGDSTTDSTAQNPAHTYTTAGAYTVSLTANGPGGTNTKTGYITASSGDGGGGGNSGLVAAYNFEEISTTVVDASGKGNHGTISGAVRTTSGKYGKALFFDGVNNWVTINDASSLDLTTGMTLEAWVYPTDNMSGWRSVLLKERSDGLVYSLQANSDTDQPSTAVRIGSDQNLQGGPWLISNTWVHLAGTYDGTTQRLYVNGSEVARRSQSGPIEVSTGVLRIGGNSIWDEFFKGRIDEVRVYNRALRADEIQTGMNRSVAMSSPPIRLVGTETIGPVADSNPQGKAQVFQAKAAMTGMVTSLSVYVDAGSTATQLVAGLYKDNNGHPGTLLAQGMLQSPAAGGWNKVLLPTTAVNAESIYWIALLSPSGVLQFRDAAGSVSQLSETSAQSTLTSLPSTWTIGNIYPVGPLSAYGAGS
jgi:PKD repeat protein